jgi:Uma2 family endonuclease
MQEQVTRRATYEDLVAVPHNLVAEIIDGRLVTHPRPAPRHALSTSVLGRLLGQSFDRKGASGPGGWWLLDEPELHLGSDIVVPDLAGWSTERLPRLPDAAWFELAPDWVCEVLSPSTVRVDRGEKRDIYAEHGVRHLWHVDPDARIVEVFALDNGRWTLLRAYRDDDSVAAPPFDAVPFPLGLLWAD